MLLTVKKVSDVTKNGNVILTLVGESTEVGTPFGNKVVTPLFCMAVKEGTHAEIGFSAEVNLDDYDIKVHDGSAVEWLHLRNRA